MAVARGEAFAIVISVRQDLYDLAGSSFAPGTVFKLLLEEPGTAGNGHPIETNETKEKIECKSLQMGVCPQNRGTPRLHP